MLATNWTGKRAIAATSLALLLSGIWSAGAAEAQDRISLERLASGICAEIDARGDSYRPAFCGAECRCLADRVASITTCNEIGESVVSTGTTGGACAADAERSNSTETFCGGTSSYAMCSFTCSDMSETCVGGSVFSPPFFGDDIIFPGVCVDLCADDAECPVVPAGFAIANVAATPDSSQVATCSCADDACPSVGISASDAHACIALIEASLGQACGVCGNGVLDPAEECDDGNTADGDGCSSACATE